MCAYFYSLLGYLNMDGLISRVEPGNNLRCIHVFTVESDLYFNMIFKTTVSNNLTNSSISHFLPTKT